MIPSAASPGIYAIRSSVDKRLYIGSAQNFKARYSQHKSQLRQGTHHAGRLQVLVNEHGLDSLSFTLLQLATPSQDLRVLEQQWFDTHLPFEPEKGFNNAPNAIGSRLADTDQKLTLSLSLSAELAQQVEALLAGSGIGSRLTLLRTLLVDAVQQAQARRDGRLMSVQLQAGEANRFADLAQERKMKLPDLVRQLLLQEYYRGQRLAPGGDDKALAQAVAHARGMRHTSTLLRTLLYDEAWRLGIKAKG
ncbi:MAG: GIY-YIG nuclease family protein [Janthinobacterium lividum]